MSRKTDMSQKRLKESRFLSQRAMSEMKKDEARIHAVAKREGKTIVSIRCLKCDCGDPDCVGLIATYKTPKKKSKKK